MRFTKMHGLGNDYIYVDCFDQRVGDRPALARAMSDRHRGVGGDGVIFIEPSPTADARMVMYNADGSRAQMCGNGIRCVGKYLIEHGLATGPELRIETDAGIRSVHGRLRNGKVDWVRVDMGVPCLEPASLPCTLPLDALVEYPLEVEGKIVRVTCVSLGNPHAVIFEDDPDAAPLESLGPLVERAAVFPERINVHVARFAGRNEAFAKSWERGAGATLACGTGACAVGVAGVVTGRADQQVTVHLPGGSLEILWQLDSHVWMSGPAVEVFTGDWPDD